MLKASLEEIKAAILMLSERDFKDLKNWLLEWDWELWDIEIAEHSKQGKLDFLIQEAKNEKG